MSGKIYRSTHLPLLIELDEDEIYTVFCPSLQGYHSDGKTIDEAMADLKLE